jgi:hypothetical protein
MNLCFAVTVRQSNDLNAERVSDWNLVDYSKDFVLAAGC